MLCDVSERYDGKKGRRSIIIRQRYYTSIRSTTMGGSRLRRNHMVQISSGHQTVTMGVMYRCPNITKESNEKIQNAIREVSKGDFIVMGDFNHGDIQPWDVLESTGIEDQPFMCIIQDNFLTQHVLEPTRGARVLDLVLSSQKEFVDNVKIQEQLGSSDHNQLHFNIKIKIDKTKVSRCRRNFRKGEMRTILVHIDWNDKMKNKTGTERWNISELDSVINIYVPMKKVRETVQEYASVKRGFQKD